MPEGQDETDGAAGGGAEGDEPSAPPPRLNGVRPNGVCMPSRDSNNNTDDYVAYALIVHHSVRQEAAQGYLLQRRTSGTCRTPHRLNSVIKTSVDLETKEVDSCRNGCVAFTALRANLTQCDVCKNSSLPGRWAARRKGHVLAIDSLAENDAG